MKPKINKLAEISEKIFAKFGMEAGLEMLAMYSTKKLAKLAGVSI